MTANIEDKRQLLQYVIKNVRLHNLTHAFILAHIAKTDGLLQRVRFVNGADNYPHALVISTVGSEGVPLRYYDGDFMTSNVNRVYDHIMTGLSSDLFLQINLPKGITIPLYEIVLEEGVSVGRISSEDLDTAHGFIEHMEKVNLQAEIDRALDKGDKELFLWLTDGLKVPSLS